MAACRINKLLAHLHPSSAVLEITPQPTAAAIIAPLKPSVGFQFVNVQRIGRVALVTLTRPEALNAINLGLVTDLNRAFDEIHQLGSAVGCIVLTGAGRAFAAGADIKEMKDMTYLQKSTSDPTIEGLCRVANVRLPLIAAVNGFALGGGCELALMCDIIFASETAKFGQPEISIGTIPGAGGTQRLTRAVGKSKAMEMSLSGLPIDANEALKFGLVSRVLPADHLLPAAMELATVIASKSRPVLISCKESLNAAYETTLNTGMQSEKKLFHGTFALRDQKEGMEAFIAKRKPNFTHS